ncbi:GNAT family N-acetyltransferase [Streptomyces sp. NPDC020800]|uniref:GNAT family N-acetyltransferase n=1 Tax=Streptomyces sp. NPDC020800 TaxID=3365092 RepID=UPI0037B74703
MPPTDASAGTSTGSVPVHTGCPAPQAVAGAGHTAAFGDGEDTLDLRLPDEFVARFAGGTADVETGGREAGQEHAGVAATRFGRREVCRSEVEEDLLDHISTWGTTTSCVGPFRLVPVRVEHDLQLVHGWMNDPAVTAFWQLGGDLSRTESHLRAQLDGDGRSVPCLGLLDGTPMSYWEIYRADLDPLARHYPARPHDTGIHLLVGSASDRGRGLGSALLRAVADLVLDCRPACARVVAEPDLRNTPSVSAFLSAGFRYAAELDLPGKRAALMIRDRVLRGLM